MRRKLGGGIYEEFLEGLDLLENGCNKTANLASSTVNKRKLVQNLH